METTSRSWYKDAVFYEVFVRAFADSSVDGIGDLPGLTSKLDYLQWLGIDAIWLLPITPSPLRDDGYDVADYTGIHADYGTLDDFRRLVDEAHRRGLRIVVEVVPNHTSDRNPWFQASHDPDHPEHARYRDWYVWSETDEKYRDARIIFLDYEPSNWTLDPLCGEYYWHRFFDHQPDLNYDNPEVQRAMLRVAQFWMDLGVDAFRVDATPYLYEREGTSCENLPETHAYLKRLRAFVDAYAPGTMLLSEANQWPEDVRPYLGGDPDDPDVLGDEFHMNFHFPLMPRIFMALARADRGPILEVLARTPPIPDNCQWATFLRCHDELTLEMVTPEERKHLWNFYAPEPRMRLNLGIRRRLAPLLGNNRPRIELANSLLLTLTGSPVIYYGDEIGMGDNIALEDRDGVRTPMQWSPEPGAGFSEAPAESFYSPVIDDEIYGYREVNVAVQRCDAGSLLTRMREMLAVRRAHPAFGRGDLQLLAPDDRSVLAYFRTWGDEVLLIVNNLSDQPREVVLALPDLDARRSQARGSAARARGAQPVDLFTAEVAPGPGSSGAEPGEPVTDSLRLSLEPYGYRWLGFPSRPGQTRHDAGRTLAGLA